jgi:energy-coupling factor transporter transmembrane protein EcfT
MTVWQDSPSVLRARSIAFSAYGYLVFFLGTAVTAILARDARVVLVFLATLVFAGLFHTRALELLRSRRVWLFIVPTLLLSPLVIGEPDLEILGLQLSRAGFWAGLWMALRALCIALAASVFARAVSVSQMAELLEGMRLKGLGFALGVATNMLPTIQETMQTSYQAIRMRGGFRTGKLRTLKLLLVTVIAGSLRRGDDIVSAAEARAFDPARSHGSSISLSGADLALAVGFVVFAVTLLLL